jgi:hypothetical protein
MINQAYTMRQNIEARITFTDNTLSSSVVYYANKRYTVLLFSHFSNSLSLFCYHSSSFSILFLKFFLCCLRQNIEARITFSSSSVIYYANKRFALLLFLPTALVTLFLPLPFLSLITIPPSSPPLLLLFSLFYSRSLGDGMPTQCPPQPPYPGQLWWIPISTLLYWVGLTMVLFCKLARYSKVCKSGFLKRNVDCTGSVLQWYCFVNWHVVNCYLKVCKSEFFKEMWIPI